MSGHAWDGQCQRCGVEASASIMSMYSTELICLDCKDAETKRPDYKQAEARDLEEYAGRLRALGQDQAARSVEDAARRLRKGEG